MISVISGLYFCKSNSYVLEKSRGINFAVNGCNFVLKFYKNKNFYPGKHFFNFIKTHELKGTYFHDAQKNFFIQGGDLLTKDSDSLNDGTGGKSFTPNNIPMIKIQKGTVCYAGTGDGKFSQNQFIIFFRKLTNKEKQEYNLMYYPFAKIVKGIECLKRISSMNKSLLLKNKINEVKISGK